MLDRQQMRQLKIEPSDQAVYKEVLGNWDAGLQSRWTGWENLRNCLPASEQSGVIPPLIFPEKQWL